MLASFSYVRPASLDQAIERLRRPGGRLHAGGTDLLGCLRDGVFGARELVSLSGLSELRGITQARDGGLRIGALTTLTEVAESDVVRRSYRALADAAASAASPQLRNQGTLGGNLCQRPRCWYFRGDFHCLRKGGDSCYAIGGENRYHAIFGGAGCYIVHPSDTAPALAALGATVRIEGPRGGRQVPLGSFFTLPSRSLVAENVLEAGDVLTEVRLPAPPAGLQSLYRKVRERQAWDFALVSAAVAVRVAAGVVAEASVVLGGVAPVPWRSPGAEKALVGRALGPEAATQAGEAAAVGAQPMEHNAYKVPLLRGAVEEAILTLAQA